MEGRVKVVVVIMMVGEGSRDVAGLSYDSQSQHLPLVQKQQAHTQKGVQLCFFRVVKAVGGACHSGA